MTQVGWDTSALKVQFSGGKVCTSCCGPTAPYTLLKYDLDGNFQWEFDTGRGINGMYWDGTDLWVAHNSSSSKTIRRINSSGVEQQSINTVQDANDVILDGSGNIYVAKDENSDDGIEKYNSSGTLQWDEYAGQRASCITIDGSKVYTGGFDDLTSAQEYTYNFSGTIQWSNGGASSVSAGDCKVSGSRVAYSGADHWDRPSTNWNVITRDTSNGDLKSWYEVGTSDFMSGIDWSGSDLVVGGNRNSNKTLWGLTPNDGSIMTENWAYDTGTHVASVDIGGGYIWVGEFGGGKGLWKLNDNGSSIPTVVWGVDLSNSFVAHSVVYTAGGVYVGGTRVT